MKTARLLLTETTELLEKLNENLDEIKKLGYEVTVKVTLIDDGSSRSQKRPLIDIELQNSRETIQV